MVEATDAELMAATRAGCRESFGALVDRHKNPLVNYLTRLAGSRERAEDLAQEAFLRLYEQRDRYREQGKLQAYLYRIATNRLRSEERQARRRRLLAPLLPAANGLHAGWAPAPEPVLATVISHEARGRVTRALAELPLDFRVPIVLAEIEGWSYADIAAALDCREGTVKSRIHRGKLRLRRKLEPYWNGGAA